MPNWAAVILAAGKGTRMKSKLPKVMHTLAGKPMIEHVLDLVTKNKVERSLVILGHGREEIEKFLAGRAEIVIQAEQLGTGHALMQALPYLDGVNNIVVLSGDQPLILPETLTELIRIHRDFQGAATVLTARSKDPYGYGRVVKDNQKLVKIVEEKDATLEERAIQEINTGTYCFNVAKLREALRNLTPKNAQGEYYLTEVFDLFLAQGDKIATYCTEDVNEALGINSRVQLAEAERVLRERILRHWMDEGVTIIDPASTFIGCEVELSHDVVLEPFTILKGKTRISEDVLLGPQTTLEDCVCETGCQVAHSVAKNAQIGPRCNVGPFAYLRPGTVLEAGVKVGDFVEIKNSRIGKGSKVPHLSYVGDSQVGQSVNIGAGTITCNYDGINKHTTIIGDNVFIGSNTNLVAPVEIGEGAVTGAGSTITKNVPAYALAVERSAQKLKENYVRNKKQ